MKMSEKLLKFQPNIMILDIKCEVIEALFLIRGRITLLQKLDMETETSRQKS